MIAAFDDILIMNAGLDMDLVVHEVVMDEEYLRGYWVPWYSTEVEYAWTVVEKVQADHPGWRFCLIGGDDRSEYGYKPFGWKAEFFGEADPEKDCGQRHGEANGSTPSEAICRAALIAYWERP